MSGQGIGPVFVYPCDMTRPIPSGRRTEQRLLVSFRSTGGTGSSNYAFEGSPVSVRERIEDAKILWDAGRKEGAFIMILIAVATTARKRYPHAPTRVKPVPEG